jgi:hypothetical protein
MAPWTGARTIAVVTACTNAAGLPDFTLTTVAVTHAEYEDGVHYDRVAERLTENGYDAPFVHFDAGDAPDFLFPAVKQYLGVSA